MTGRRVSTVLWAMISREDDPGRVDWAAVSCLVAYSAMAIGLLGLFASLIFSGAMPRER